MLATIPGRRFFVIAIAAAHLTLPLCAQEEIPVRITADPTLTSLAQADSGSDPLAILTAGIYFSGTDETRARHATTYASSALDYARTLMDAYPEPYARGQAILAYLHGTWLKRYVETETTIDSALIDGRYNCVSSSILYLALALAAGLDVHGVVTPDHALCAVRIGEQWVDVETTNPLGFDPGTKKEFHDSFGRVTGYSYVPPSDSAKRRDADFHHMNALILWNRANLFERSGKFAQALALSVDAYAWYRSDESLAHLAGRAHNLAAVYLNARRWDDGIAFMESVMALYGPIGKLAELTRQARAARLADSLQTMDPALARTAVQNAWASGQISESEYETMYSYALSQQANKLFQAGLWLEAWQMLEAARIQRPRSSELARLTRSAKANLIASWHNNFAQLYNAGRYREALDALAEGLSLFPTDPTLLRDQELARKALSR